MNHLPSPQDTALAHTNQFADFLRQYIESSGGSIPFSAWMEKVLYQPGFGYYAVGNTHFGAAGDFITSPEISPLFGQALAEQCIEIFQTLSNNIIEFGAGTGKLALSILQHLAKYDALPSHYYILEISPTLRLQQQELFKQQAPEFLSLVSWLNEIPHHFNGIVLANEVIDAMPVDLISKQEMGWSQRYVTWQHSQFIYEHHVITDPELLTFIQQHLPNDLPIGYETEINLWMKGWIKNIAEHTEEAIILLIDYGDSEKDLYVATRSQGTLRCFYQHQVHDNALLWPGLQDITADVNFTALAETAYQHGLSILGYTYQTYFLLNNNILNFVGDDYREKQAIKSLTLPQEMGTRFKVIALGKNTELSLQGFQQNLLHEL